jgi:hypothetical protein
LQRQTTWPDCVRDCSLDLGVRGGVSNELHRRGRDGCLARSSEERARPPLRGGRARGARGHPVSGVGAPARDPSRSTHRTQSRDDPTITDDPQPVNP